LSTVFTTLHSTVLILEENIEKIIDEEIRHNLASYNMWCGKT
jgi:hypothetical protein